MKALIPFMLAMVFLLPASFSQVDKTQMSLDVSNKYQENLGQLAQLTWKRKAEGHVDGKLAMTSLSSVSIGPDGKLNTVDKVVLEMPAKKIRANITNTEFAKKL